MIRSLLIGATRFLVGGQGLWVGCGPERTQRIYFANHASPLDTILLWAARARRRRRPGVHCALAVWGAVTLFLALSQRLNVYYAVPLAGLTTLELVRWISIRARSRGLGRIPSAAVALLLAGGLLWPMSRGLGEELAATYVPGSDLFATLARMRTELPHAVGPYDPGLLGPPPLPAALANARSVMTPWSLGHFTLYEAELPVVAKTDLPTVWFRDARFGHLRHAKVACEQCHARIRESGDTADVNLPGKALCESCHAADSMRSAGTRCVLCHIYHASRAPGAAPMPAHTLPLPALLGFEAPPPSS